jgi:predicted  nucleic acid-binding Zn-ribbon protein
VSPELRQLIELQELDLEINRVTERLARIPAERDQTENDFKNYAAEFLALKSKYDQTLEERKNLEADLATTQQHHDKFKQDLMRVTNEKEYTTALREIDATKKQISAYETEILKRMEEAEKLETELSVMSPDVDRKRAEVDQALASLDQERGASEQAMRELEERRDRLSKGISKQLFAVYDRMSRLRRGQALAEVRNDAICSACRMKVRPKVFSDVRKGNELITCEHCGRILYYKIEDAPSAEAATSQPGKTEQ